MRNDPTIHQVEIDCLDTDPPDPEATPNDDGWQKRHRLHSRRMFRVSRLGRLPSSLLVSDIGSGRYHVIKGQLWLAAAKGVGINTAACRVVSH